MKDKKTRQEERKENREIMQDIKKRRKMKKTRNMEIRSKDNSFYLPRLKLAKSADISSTNTTVIFIKTPLNAALGGSLPFGCQHPHVYTPTLNSIPEALDQVISSIPNAEDL
ncbi:hypothetical protein CHS0354_024994 [Potamilus streckersoni]|uniref:Uncharacterized protein n=1 Tax=Potamilus streckersoni TaxID=2493646 RepID=A0AAE0W6Y2_9BIVA|nr:hypothetical protein CHS0354_024994 [Potamilus streckersoni]